MRGFLQAARKRICTASVALALGTGMGVANADIIASGAFNSFGYDIINFSTTGGVVDMVYTGGFADPTFSLFDASGAHLITNDEAGASHFPHLTRTLAAGSYALLVSFCCVSTAYASLTGGSFADTDGVNTGRYWIGGAATLSGMEAFIQAVGDYGGSRYSATISIPDPARVPAPATIGLLGLGLAALGWARRRSA